MKEIISDSITKFSSDVSGPTLAIFAGVHGNEKAGVLALERLISELDKILQSGTVYAVMANPQAIEKNVRFIESNLNRMFQKPAAEQTYEAVRAQELISILDECDALLDLHASNTPDSVPFLIGEEKTWDFCSKLPFTILAYGVDPLEPGGTDSYMTSQGKFGLCVECGYAGESKAYTDLAYETTLSYLKYFGVIQGEVPQSNVVQRKLRMKNVVFQPSNSFAFIKKYADFETVPAGTIFATDGMVEYRVTEESVIVFAAPGKQFKAEACLLGQWESV